jgi:hypothetical protein
MTFLISKFVLCGGKLAVVLVVELLLLLRKRMTLEVRVIF